ncbi:cupredoxin domain-containing protein [Metapseudomonas boanensis]|uniref:Copper-binding protein n=1 Tax=Metapseudomonas boanensis TaxID=2822138 RepID=A0ABS5XL65_9GAMM|nr:copper-binding protein [Pseudomonas boanensis]MBT8768454.1 copper-binding protein [Pseudomonas boanensis]
MRTVKHLFLPLLLILSLLGFDRVLAAGDLTRRTISLPDLVLGSEESDYSLSQQEYQLETGKAYQLKVIASGKKEYAFQAPEFATSIYLRKVEAGGVEVKAVTLTELEFEDASEAEIFFVPIKPGRYRFYAKGLEAKGMQGSFVVK